MATKQVSGIVASILGLILILAPLAFGIPLAFGGYHGGYGGNGSPPPASAGGFLGVPTLDWIVALFGGALLLFGLALLFLPLLVLGAGILLVFGFILTLLNLVGVVR